MRRSAFDKFRYARQVHSNGQRKKNVKKSSLLGSRFEYKIKGWKLTSRKERKKLLNCLAIDFGRNAFIRIVLARKTIARHLLTRLALVERRANNGRKTDPFKRICSEIREPLQVIHITAVEQSARRAAPSLSPSAVVCSASQRRISPFSLKLFSRDTDPKVRT